VTPEEKISPGSPAMSGTKIENGVNSVELKLNDNPLFQAEARTYQINVFPDKPFSIQKKYCEYYNLPYVFRSNKNITYHSTVDNIHHHSSWILAINSNELISAIQAKKDIKKSRAKGGMMTIVLCHHTQNNVRTKIEKH
jgi:hypothetical protein